jgi:hypothetical protein
MKEGSFTSCDLLVSKFAFSNSTCTATRRGRWLRRTSARCCGTTPTARRRARRTSASACTPRRSSSSSPNGTTRRPGGEKKTYCSREQCLYLSIICSKGRAMICCFVIVRGSGVVREDAAGLFFRSFYKTSRSLPLRAARSVCSVNDILSS